ncbi:hypothetical protein [Caldibacillus debilis]|nr:hypothetical protein [Caldibacillus debilis]
MYCVYNENLIVLNNARHYRQFRETRDGDRLPVFPNDKAVIFMDSDARYRVQTEDGEVMFIGCGGIDEAISRIYYAQPYVEIEVIADGRHMTLEEFEQQRELSEGEST